MGTGDEHTAVIRWRNPERKARVSSGALYGVPDSKLREKIFVRSEAANVRYALACRAVLKLALESDDKLKAFCKTRLLSWRLSQYRNAVASGPLEKVWANS